MRAVNQRGARGPRKAGKHPIRKVLAENVRRLMDEHRVITPDIGKAQHMSRRTIDRLLSEEVASTVDTVGAIADYFRVAPFELLIDRPAARATTPSTRRTVQIVKNDHESLRESGLGDKNKSKKQA